MFARELHIRHVNLSKIYIYIVVFHSFIIIKFIISVLILLFSYPPIPSVKVIYIIHYYYFDFSTTHTQLLIYITLSFDPSPCMQLVYYIYSYYYHLFFYSHQAKIKSPPLTLFHKLVKRIFLYKPLEN